MKTKSVDVLHAKIKAHNITIHVILVYFSIPNSREDRVRNQEMKKEIEAILDQAEEVHDAALVLGDFNGHVHMLGYQKEDENGRIVLDWINNFGLTLLNLDEACKGTYTWARQEQKSVIDFVMANRNCYKYFVSLHIDEEKSRYI